MTTLRLSRLTMAVGITALLTAQALGQIMPKQDLKQAALDGQGVTPNVQKRLIVVSLEDRKLALLEDGKVKRLYSIAVGKPSTPSPKGTFTIARRVINPTYHHDGITVLPGPGNPVGTRWMGLSVSGYGIHGTNEPNSIGKAASHGCIRMARADLEEFYTMVAVGDTVELVGERNETTAQLFGNGENPAAPVAQPVQTTSASVTTSSSPAQSALADTSGTEKTSHSGTAVATLSALR